MVGGKWREGRGRRVGGWEVVGGERWECGWEGGWEGGGGRGEVGVWVGGREVVNLTIHC